MKIVIVVGTLNIFLALDIYHYIPLHMRLSDNSTLIDNITYNKQINLIFTGILEKSNQWSPSNFYYHCTLTSAK